MNRPPHRAWRALLLLLAPLGLLGADAASQPDAGTPRPAPASKSGGGEPGADLLSGSTISAKSMCEEVRRTLASKQEEFAKLEAEKLELQKQRDELERLALKIAKAREELHKETTRLEELAAKGPLSPEAAGDAAAAAAAADIAAVPLSPQAVDTVSKRMRAMKPEAAAAVVKRLDPGLASMILMRMRPAESGAIIGKLDADLAAELITLAATGEVPTP